MAEINNINNSKKILPNYSNYTNLNYFSMQELEKLPDAPTEPITQRVTQTEDTPFKNLKINSQKIKNCLPMPGALLPSSSLIETKKRKPSRRRVYSKPRKRIRKKNELFVEKETDFSFSTEIDSLDFNSDDSSDTIIMEDFDIPPVLNGFPAKFTSIATSSNVKHPELGKLLISNDMIKSDFPVKVKEELIESNIALNSSKICSTDLINIKKEPVDFDTIPKQPVLPEIRDVFPVQNIYVSNYRAANSDAKKYPDFCFREAGSISVPKPKQTARKRTAPRNPTSTKNALQTNSSFDSTSSVFNENQNSDIKNQLNIVRKAKMATSATNKSSSLLSEENEVIPDKKIVHSKNKLDTALTKPAASSTVFPNLLRGLLEQEKLTKSSNKKKPPVKRKASPKNANSKLAAEPEGSFHNVQEKEFLVKDSENPEGYMFPFENRLLFNKKNVKKSKSAKLPVESALKHPFEKTSVVENDFPPDIISPRKKPPAKKKVHKKSKNRKQLEETVFQNVCEGVFSVGRCEDQQTDQFFSENSPFAKKKVYKISKNKLSEEFKNALDQEFIVTDSEIQPACSSGEKLLPEIKNNKIENALEESKNTSEQNLFIGITEDLTNFSNPLNISPRKKKTPKRKAPLSKQKNFKVTQNKTVKPRNALGKFLPTKGGNQPTYLEEKLLLESNDSGKLQNVISEKLENASYDDLYVGSTENQLHLSPPVNALPPKKKTPRKKKPLTMKKNSKISKNKKLLGNALNEEFIVSDSKNEEACPRQEPLSEVKDNELNNILSDELKNASEEDLSVGNAEDLMYLSPPINICLPKKKKPKRSPRKRFSNKKKKPYKKSNFLNNSNQSVTDIKNIEAVGSVSEKEQSIEISLSNLGSFDAECVPAEDASPAISVQKKVVKKRSPKKNSRAKKSKSKSAKKDTNSKNTENNISTEIDFTQNTVNTHSTFVLQPSSMKSGDGDFMIRKSNSLQNSTAPINEVNIPRNSTDKLDLPEGSSILFQNDRISLFNSSSKSILNLKIKKEPEDLVNEAKNIDCNIRDRFSNASNAEYGVKKDTTLARVATYDTVIKERLLVDNSKDQNPHLAIQHNNSSKFYGNISIKTEVLSDDECSIIEVIKPSPAVNVSSMPTESLVEPVENSISLTESSMKPSENSIKSGKTRKDPILSRLEDIAPNELLLGTRSETKRLRLLAATSNVNGKNEASKLDSNQLQIDKTKQISSNVSNAPSLMSESTPHSTQNPKSKQAIVSQTSCLNEAFLQSSNDPKQISSTTSSPILVSDVSSSLNFIHSKQISLATSSPVPVSKGSLSHISTQSKLSSLISENPTSVPDSSPSQVSIESNIEISDKFTLNAAVSIKTEVDSDEEDIPLSTLVSLKRKESIACRVEGTDQIALDKNSKTLDVLSSCSAPNASEFPQTEKPIHNSSKHVDTLPTATTSLMDTELHNNSTSKSCLDISISNVMSNCSQNFSDKTAPEGSIAINIPNLNSEIPNKGYEKHDFLISVTQIKKEKDIWPEEIEGPSVSSHLSITDIHSSSHNSTITSMPAVESFGKNINKSPLYDIAPQSSIAIQLDKIPMNNDYISFRDCLKERDSLKEKTDSYQTLRLENSTRDSDNLHSINKIMNLNANENYSPITVNEMNEFESRNFTPSSNRESLISKFLSRMPSNIGSISEKNVNADSLMDSSFNFNNDLCSKSEDLDSSFSPRFSTPFNQDVSSRAVDSTPLWIGNENSSDSIQTHSSNVSFSYQNYDFSSSENLSNYEKNMKFFFKFPFPGDILSGFYKCRKKLKGKHYLRANPLPWNLSYEEVASKLHTATCNGADKEKDESDINDIHYYTLNDEEIGCYHRLLGVAPSKKLISKCYKPDLKSISEHENPDNSSLLAKSSVDYCGISVMPSIFITDFNEIQRCKQEERITELLKSTRRNVESLLPSETRYTLSPIEGSSKNVEPALSIADKSFPFVFSDSSNSQSISTSCIPKVNNVQDNFSQSKNVSENLSVYQNINLLTPNTLNLVNLPTVKNTVSRTGNIFSSDITSQVKANNQNIIDKCVVSIGNSNAINSVMDCSPTLSNLQVTQINLVNKDFQPGKLPDPEIVLDKVIVEPDNHEKLSTVNTSAITSSQTCIQPTNSSGIYKTDVLTKVLQAIGLSNFGMPKTNPINNLVPLQMNKMETLADSSKQSNTLEIGKDMNIPSSFTSNSVDDSNKINEECLKNPLNHSNKESMFEYVINNTQKSQCNVIDSSAFVSKESIYDKITNSTIKTIQSNDDTLKDPNRDEQSLLLGKNSSNTESLSVSSLHEPNSLCSDNNEYRPKPQLALNALDSIVKLNTDDLKKILETAKYTNVSNDLSVDSYSNTATQRNSLNDARYVSEYDRKQTENVNTMSICSDYMYYDYKSPFLRIPTVRDYEHKSPLETVTNERKDSNVYANQPEEDISKKNYEEAASDSDEGVDNEFLPEYADPNLDSEKEENNPSSKEHDEVPIPHSINKNDRGEQEKLASTEESNKELPQYKSRWERIMERKAIEKNKDEDLLLSYFHLSRSRRSNIPKKSGGQDPSKNSGDTELKSKLQKNISTSTKSSTVKKDALLPVPSSDSSTSNLNAKKITKGQKSLTGREMKEKAAKRDSSPLRKTDTKFSIDEGKSFHKKSTSKDDQQINKLNKVSPIKKKAKFKQLSLSDDSSSNLFAPDKVIKVSDEKKPTDSFEKNEKDKKKMYGRVTNRGSFLTQSSLSEKPKVKTIQPKKSSSKPKDKSVFSDEIHSRINIPNIELAAGTPTLPKYAYDYFDDSKDDSYSYNGYPKKRLSISNCSDMSISPIADFPSPPADSAVSIFSNNSSSNVLPFIQSGKSVPDPRRKVQYPVLPYISNNVVSPFASTATNITPRRELETTPVFQSSLVSNSKFNFDSLSNQSNDKLSTTSQLPVHNRSKHRSYKCVCLPPRHMKDSVGHTVFETMNVLLLILEWNVDWLFQQRKNSSPPPISKCVNKVINTYESFESYYNTYFPLLLLETWQRIYVSWNHLHTAPPYICDIKSYTVEQSSIKVECEAIFNPSDTDRGLFPEEGNIMMVKFGTKSKGGIKTLGYITEVKVRAVNPSIDSQNKCYQYLKCSPSDHLQLLQMSFIGAYTSEDFDIKLPIRVHVLCNVKINLKQNDALLKTKDSPLGKNILNPMEDELRVVELASRDSIDEEKIAFCVKEIVKGILSPHPIPIVTIVKSYPSSDRLMILPPLIKRMKDSYGTKVLLCARTTKCLIDIGLYLDENHVKFVITGKRADVPLKLKKYLVEDLAVNRALSDQLSEGKQEDPICKENLKQESVAKAKKFVFNECDVILSLIKNCHDDCLGQAFADGDSVSQLCCIIDEANLCTEPELLIPVLFGISKLILIGNPDVTAKVCSKTASSYGYGKSLFHRAYELDLISE